MKTKLSAKTIKGLAPSDKAFEVVDNEIKGFLLRVQPTGRMTFYYSYRTTSKSRKRIKIGVLGSELTIQQARDIATQYAAQVVSGEDIQATKQQIRHDAQEAKKRTLEHFLTNQYQPWATANLKSAQTSIDRIKYSFPDLLQKPMGLIKVAQIERWRTGKLNEGLKPSTINRCVNSLRAVLTKAVEWEYLESHPLQKLKALHIDSAPKVRFLNESEETKLLEALTTRDEQLKEARASGNRHRQTRGYPLLPCLEGCAYADRMSPLVILSLKTGMRRGELFDLEWQNVDFDQKVLTITAETAKSKRTRHIPLSPTAFEALKEWQRQAPLQSGRVFPSDDGGRLDNVRKSWASILKAADISHFRWHDMRHDFASKLVMKGVPLNTVRELCGHSDLNTTLRYAHLAPDHKSEAVALIG